MLKKGDIWDGAREAVIPRERKYHLRFSSNQQRYCPTISYIDRDGGTWEEYEAIFAKTFSESLVKDINDVAEQQSGQPGGVFYVNEHKQVIKPIGDGTESIIDIYVGEYPALHLTFETNDGVHIDNGDVSNLEVGSPWPHQKVGMRYHYSAYRRRVFYRKEEGNVIRRIAIKVPAHLEEGLSRVKPLGGQLYVNEHGHVFCPETDDPNQSDIYVGTIDPNSSEWFTKTS